MVATTAYLTRPVNCARNVHSISLFTDRERSNSLNRILLVHKLYLFTNREHFTFMNKNEATDHERRSSTVST
jgi:hypothetical protein